MWKLRIKFSIKLLLEDKRINISQCKCRDMENKGAREFTERLNGQQQKGYHNRYSRVFKTNDNRAANFHRPKENSDRTLRYSHKR